MLHKNLKEQLSTKNGQAISELREENRKWTMLEIVFLFINTPFWIPKYPERIMNNQKSTLFLSGISIRDSIREYSNNTKYFIELLLLSLDGHSFCKT